MHMRVVDEIMGPGLQDTDQTDLTTDQAWISGQFLDRLRGSVKEQVVDQFLVTIGQVAEFGGQREGQQEIGDGQQQFLLQGQPLFGLLLLTLGTMTVTTGVVTVIGFATRSTAIDLSSQIFSTAMLNGAHGGPLGRQ